MSIHARFTTKPYADQGLVRFVRLPYVFDVHLIDSLVQIGSVPTPWPSWMVAAHTNPIRAPVKPVREFLSSLTTHVRKFAQGLQKVKPVGIEINDTPIATDEDASAAEHSTNVDYIVEKFGYPREDVRRWLATVGYPDEVGLVDLRVISQTLE